MPTRVPPVTDFMFHAARLVMCVTLVMHIPSKSCGMFCTTKVEIIFKQKSESIGPLVIVSLVSLYLTTVSEYYQTRQFLSVNL